MEINKLARKDATFRIEAFQAVVSYGDPLNQTAVSQSGWLLRKGFPPGQLAAMGFDRGVDTEINQTLVHEKYTIGKNSDCFDCESC